jgi:hypothetical protein
VTFFVGQPGTGLVAAEGAFKLDKGDSLASAIWGWLHEKDEQ